MSTRALLEKLQIVKDGGESNKDCVSLKRRSISEEGLSKSRIEPRTSATDKEKAKNNVEDKNDELKIERLTKDIKKKGKDKDNQAKDKDAEDESENGKELSSKEWKWMEKVERIRSKFEIPWEEAANPVKKRFHCVCHMKVIHHGFMYIFPHYLCFASVTNKIRKVAFGDIITVRLRAVGKLSVSAIVDGKEVEVSFSHFANRKKTFHVISLVWQNALREKLEGTAHAASDSGCQIQQITEGQQGIETSAGTAEALPPVDTTVMPPTCTESIFSLPVNASAEPNVKVTLPVSLRQFWQFFLSDESNHLHKMYSMVATVKNISAWEPTAEGSIQRVLNFDTEVNSLVAKGVCSVRQTLKCGILENGMFVMSSEAKFDGMPYVNDFVVRSFWRAQSARCPEEVDVAVWIWVHWFKSPFAVKGFIESGSIKEAKQSTELFFTLAKQRCAKLLMKKRPLLPQLQQQQHPQQQQQPHPNQRQSKILQAYQQLQQRQQQYHTTPQQGSNSSSSCSTGTGSDNAESPLLSRQTKEALKTYKASFQALHDLTDPAAVNANTKGSTQGDNRKGLMLCVAVLAIALLLSWLIILFQFFVYSRGSCCNA